MQIFQRIPRLLRWIFAVVASFLLVMSFSRLIIYWSFNPPGKAFSGSAFIMGLRYDARVVCVMGIYIMLIGSLPLLNPFKNAKAIRFWNNLVPLFFMFMVLVLAIDYYHFDYLHQRLNASVLNYVADAGISFNMMWQTYPLLKIALVIIILAVLARYYFKRLLARYTKQDPFSKSGVSCIILLPSLSWVD